MNSYLQRYLRRLRIAGPRTILPLMLVGIIVKYAQRTNPSSWLIGCLMGWILVGFLEFIPEDWK